MKRRTLIAGTAAVAVLPGFPAQAAEFEVQMLNRGEAGSMVFEPALTRVAVGDTVKFVPTNPSHNAETIPEILPEGAEPFKGGINKEISVTFEVPGTYALVDHALSRVEKGLVAQIKVEGPQNPEIFDAPEPMM